MCGLCNGQRLAVHADFGEFRRGGQPAAKLAAGESRTQFKPRQMIVTAGRFQRPADLQCGTSNERCGGLVRRHARLILQSRFRLVPGPGAFQRSRPRTGGHVRVRVPSSQLQPHVGRHVDGHSSFKRLRLRHDNQPQPAGRGESPDADSFQFKRCHLGLGQPQFP